MNEFEFHKGKCGGSVKDVWTEASAQETYSIVFLYGVFSLDSELLKGRNHVTYLSTPGTWHRVSTK